MNQKLAISEKYTLTIKEASQYFGIGVKKMRQLAESHLGTFSAYSGNRYLIIRTEFEKYLLTSPTMHKGKGEKLKRAQLEEKEIFNPEEAIEFYDLSRRKFRRLLEEKEELPFVAFFGKRKIIIRSEFENYLEGNPDMGEGLKNGKKRVS